MLENFGDSSKKIQKLNTIYEILHDTIKLQEIQVLTKAFQSPGLEIKEVKTEPTYNIRIEDLVSAKGDLKVITKLIDVLTRYSVHTANFRIKYIFEFRKELEYVLEYSDHVEIDPIVNEFLDHIILATTRGIMYIHLQGTLLENKFLPLTKPSVVSH